MHGGSGSFRCWRALVDSPLLWATWTAVMLACFAIIDVAASLRGVAEVRATAAAALAGVVAEAAVMQSLPMDSSTNCASMRVGGVDVAMRHVDNEWVVTSEAGGRSFVFAATELAGAAPEAFAVPCSAVDPAMSRLGQIARQIAASQLPRLDDAALSRAVRADQMTVFRRDRAVALLTFEMGTERDDFVFDAERLGGLEAAGDLVVVPGHLWIEVAPQPLRLALQEDLVIVVHGNLYVGRSIVVEGKGRLVFVTQAEPGAAIFADVDGNGRWSADDELRRGAAFAGPVEGTGNVYFGLPGTASSIAMDVALAAAGEIHVGATVHVAGPCIVPFGVTVSRQGASRLVPVGSWVFRTERERVPGFATTGAPRPSLLRPHLAEPTPSVQQGLYVPSPAR